MKILRVVMIAAALLMLANTAGAQGGAAPAAPSGFIAEVTPQFEDAATKMVKLAEAIPAEKYSWRPMEGVRSTSEVFMHMAGGAYSFANALGTPIPAGVNPREFSGITDKARVTEEVKKAMEHLRQAMAKVTDAEQKARFRGRDSTAREVMLAATVHLHEHLGQAIAYARMNNVVPPWTAEREEQQRQQAPAKRPPSE